MAMTARRQWARGLIALVIALGGTAVVHPGGALGSAGLGSACAFAAGGHHAALIFEHLDRRSNRPASPSVAIPSTVATS